MSSNSLKRKRPPTFQHYPINRAKQLKKTWVETVKIKSKWKAEKRKEGITQDVGEEEAKREDEEENPESTPPEKRRTHAHPTTQIPKRSKEQEVAAEPSAVSLRELTREAYSRNSLHTFKADPLKRRRGTPDRGKGGTRGRGGHQGRGRGQPNMKLRMNAMLGKIKQDYAS